MLVKFELLNEYIKSWKKSKDINGLLLTGNSGYGKTFEILKQLKDEEHLVINSHVTALKLYMSLYYTRNGFLIIDDVLELFKNSNTCGLLLAALQTNEKDRLISWYTTSNSLGDVPERFYYNGKLAIICNKLPSKLEHLESRCFHYELSLTYNELIEKIEDVRKAKGYPKELTKFIIKHTNKYTNPKILNLRLLIKLNSLYKESNNWKQIGIHLIKNDKRLYVLNKIVKKFNNVEDQINEYYKLTGKKRASFYRDKKLLKLL